MTSKGKKLKRPPEIDKAVKEFRAASRSELAKKEVVQFRMDTDDLQQLFQVCALKKKPVGTLVREWVLEHTQQELATFDVTFNHESGEAQRAIKLEQDIAEINSQLNDIKHNVERLEAVMIKDLHRKTKNA